MCGRRNYRVWRAEERHSVLMSVRVCFVCLWLSDTYQSDMTINRKYGGTGLGLVIVHRLIDLFGGTIDCDSTLGGGTKFTIAVREEPEERAIIVFISACLNGSSHCYPLVCMCVVFRFHWSDQPRQRRCRLFRACHVSHHSSLC